MRNKLSPYYNILNESRLKEHQNWEDLFLPNPPSTAPKEKTKTCEFCGEPISSGKLCGQCKFMLMNNPDSSFARKHPELLESLYRTGLEPLPGDQVDLNSTEMAPLDKHGVDIWAGGLEYDKDPNKEFKFPLYGPSGERQPESFKSTLHATRLRESADIEDVSDYNSRSHAQGEVGEKVYVQSAIRPDLHFEGVILRKTPKMHPDQETEFFTIGDDEGNVLYKNVPLDDIYALNEAKSSPFHVGDRVLIKIPEDELDVYGDWNGLKGTIVGDLSNPKDFYRTQIWRDPQFQGLVVEPDEDQDGGNLRISPAWLRHLRSKKRESVDDMDLDDYEEPAGMVGQKIKVQVPWDDLTDAPNTIAQEYDKGEGVVIQIIGNRVLANIWDPHYNDWVEVMFPRRWIHPLHESEETDIDDVSEYDMNPRYDIALQALLDNDINAVVKTDSRGEPYIEVRNLPNERGGFSLITQIISDAGLSVWRRTEAQNVLIPGEGWGIDVIFDLQTENGIPIQESALEPTLGDMRKGNLENDVLPTESPIPPPPPETGDVSDFEAPGYSPDEQRILDTYLQYYPQLGNAQAISQVSNDLHVPYAAVFAIVSAYENKFNSYEAEGEEPADTEAITPAPSGFFESVEDDMDLDDVDVPDLKWFEVEGENRNGRPSWEFLQAHSEEEAMRIAKKLFYLVIGAKEKTPPPDFFEMPEFFEAVGDDMNLDDVDLPDETSKENYKDNRLKMKAAYKALEYLQKQVAPYCNINLDTITEGDYNYYVVAENWPTVKAKKTKLDLTIVDRDYSNTVDVRSGNGGFSIELNRTTLEVNLFDTSEAFDNGLNRFKVAARAAQTGEIQNDDDFRKQLTQVLKGLGFNRISVLKNEEGAILSFYKDALQEMTDIVKQQGWDKRGIEVRKYGHDILLDIPFLAPSPNTPAPKPSKRGSSNKSVRP